MSNAFHNFIPDRRWWENYQESFRATDALYRIGEWAAFVFMWKPQDAAAGDVKRCPTCTYGQNLVDQVYQQPAYDRCPTCYGVLFAGAHGGVKAMLIRPSIWQYGEKDIQWLPRGETEVQNATVTTSGDVRLFKRDYIFRGDGYRFGVNSVQVLHLSSGFGTPSHTVSALTSSYGVAAEHESSPAFMIPPNVFSLEMLIGTDNQRTLPDFSRWEFADGPLPTGV